MTPLLLFVLKWIGYLIGGAFLLVVGLICLSFAIAPVIIRPSDRRESCNPLSTDIHEE